MQILVAPVAYLSILAAIFFCSALTYVLYVKYEDIDDKITYQESVTLGNVSIPISESEKRERTFYQVTGIIMLVFTILLAVVVIALRKEIRIAVKVYEEAAKALRKMPTIFI